MKTYELKPFCLIANKVLFRNKKYSIETYINEHTKKNNLVVVIDEWYTNWVMIYDNKTIGLDRELPNYIKQKLYSLTPNYI